MHDLIERQAAIDAHYEYCNKHPDAGFPVWSLKILKELPSAQPVAKDIYVPVKDCISRKATIDAIFSEALYEPGMKKRDVDAVVLAIFEKIKSLPSAQPETHEERTETHACDCISRQAAINALEKVAELYPWRVPGNRDSYSSYNEAWQDALNRADSEIEALPSAQPKKTQLSEEDAISDCISRQDAIDAICEHGTDLERRGITVLAVANHKQVTVDLLEKLPSVQPQPQRTGRWINIRNDNIAECDQCGITGRAWMNFCPICGARMEGE